ncbi:flagellin N-terminal helical domain-containing protein [Metabacillus bambusae]|uniref:Flagellin n=1 Tax=Metabacillus bambusae TaxID=2795218 RepID=A0ABS3N0D2_9BACI|nr:flagellin [Metabacillus bambusae]MBO1511732.1 hypothetical protein [Metabacillus bambusae]
MIIRHNISSLNSLNKLKTNNAQTAKASEKLSSGLRINIAADDSAGLAISEKMRGQIRGLEQAERNIQDGISLVQVAEGGVAQINNPILQRMRELAIQAANDTLTDADRKAIQKEIEQLKESINHIANNIEYNAMKLLNGTNPHPYAGSTTTTTTPSYENVLSLSVDSSGRASFRANEGFPETSDDNNQPLIYGSGSTSSPSVLIDGTQHRLWNGGISGSTTQVSATEYNTTYSNVGGTGVNVVQNIKIVEDKYEITYKATNSDSSNHNIGFYFHMDVLLGGDDSAPFIVNGATITQDEAYTGGNVPSTFNVFNDTGADIQATGVITGSDIIEAPDEFRIGAYSSVSNVGWSDSNSSIGDSGYALLWNADTIGAGGSRTVNTFYGLTLPSTVTPRQAPMNEEGPFYMNVHTGPNSSTNLSIQLSDVRTEKLGIDNVNLETRSGAVTAISIIDNAIEKVISERTKYGAFQNRLEHSLSNVISYNVNLSEAESRIRDTDMAKEMMSMTKNNILSQASQSMLAQANQKPQGVLQLLQ